MGRIRTFKSKILLLIVLAAAAVFFVALSKSPYASGRVVLEPGEALLLYPDGVTEAMDLSETLYSDQRLKPFLTGNRDSAPRQIIGDLVSDVRHFACEAAQSDDITALALRFFGSEKK